MVPYYILVGVPLYMSLFMMNKGTLTIKRERQKYVIGTFFIIYFLLLALRHESVGVDLQRYLPFFNRVAKTPWGNLFSSSNKEPGYLVLNKLIGTLFPNERIFIILISLITVLPIMKFYTDESENAILSMAIFLILPSFQMLFSGLRQAIAMAFAVPAYYATKKKKLIPFILFVILAILFHKSAFIMFAFYPIYHMNITRNKVVLLVPIMVGVYALRKRVFGFLFRFLSDDFEHYNQVSDTGAYAMLLLFALFAIFSYVCASNEQIDRDIIGLRNILLLSVGIQIFAAVNVLAMRMNYYFIIFIPILIPKIINRTPEKDRALYRALSLIMIVFFVSYFLLSARKSADIMRLYPYKFFWEV